MHVCVLSHALLFETPWAIACQALLSIGFFRQEYWSGLPFPPSGDLPNPGIEPGSLTLQAYSLLSEPESDMLECITVTVASLRYLRDTHAA